MNTTVLIAAAGQQVRWARAEYKQLALLGGEPLLARTRRQVRCRAGDEPMLLTSADLAVSCHDPRIVFTQPPDRRFLASTILSSRFAWGRDVTAVLLGDVCFSASSMDRALAAPASGLAILEGCGGDERFSFTFTHERHDDVVAALAVAVARAVRGEGEGKLKDLRHAFAAIGLADMDGYFNSDDTYTTDFDTEERYATFCHDVVDTGRLDDLSP